MQAEIPTINPCPFNFLLYLLLTPVANYSHVYCLRLSKLSSKDL